VKPTITVKVNKRQLEALTGRLRPEASRLVRKTGLKIVATEQELSRVDAGTMRAGWKFDMVDDLTGVNYNNVEHTIHNEYGTATMTAQPMMHPAFDQARDDISRGLKDLLSR